MAVTTFPFYEKLGSLIDLQIHQVALKNFHYHIIGEFPYNLLICILDNPQGADNYCLNCVTGQHTRLQTGFAYILPCHVPVKYERTPEVTGVTIRFNLTMFYGMDIFDGHMDIQEIFAARLVSMLKNNISNSKLSEAQQIKTSFMLKTEVSQLCLSCWPKQQKDLPLGMWKFEKVFKYVREHASAGLSVADMARVFEMRQDVFSRAFTRDTGISPKRYISDILVRKISVLLLTSNKTLREIADELDFNSEYYLSRFFKNQTRLSPREYKKEFLGEAYNTLPNA